MSITIASLQAEHHESGFGIGVPSPRLSWRFGSTSTEGWVQASYEVTVERDGKAEHYSVTSDASNLVPWPSAPLRSRERVSVTVKSTGTDGLSTTSPRLKLEAALYDRDDWTAQLISGPRQDRDKAKAPFRLAKSFRARAGGRARLYATAHGIYQVEINGKPVGDQVLTPGWQSYQHHLNYQIYDVSGLLKEGGNTIAAHVGEGWFAGRLRTAGLRNVWGDRPGFLGQLEVDGQVVVGTDASWDVLVSPITESSIYDGETVDTTLAHDNKPIGKAEIIDFPSAQLVSPDAPPVRRLQELQGVDIISTPSGKKVIDFGQNLVGWVRIDTDLRGNEVVMRHAEVLEDGELGVRPLRSAKATTRIKLGGASTRGWEPKFTFYGFRYVEITGVDVNLSDYTAIVVASDMKRTGHFECSHQLINQLHKNVVWGMLGNFVSVPTDCPQRDERLGWTGDLQVFAPTANYLFDTSGFLSGWLSDLAAETKHYNGIVPDVIPHVSHELEEAPRSNAAWADCVAITPWDLHTTYADAALLERQYESMCLWLDKGMKRLPNGLWLPTDKQYGDWLDPKAPPAYPAHGATDPYLCANAYLLRVTGIVRSIAGILEKAIDVKRYGDDYARLRKEFHREYVTSSGRLVSDTQTAIALALHFDLLDNQQQRRTAIDRLDWLVRWDSFKVSTGFCGTPIILDTLAENGKLQLAYRMLQNKELPSWLYPVMMGATTIWERWDSMLPDGKINPGQMTSFNHYALGSCAHFLHTVVGGLSPLEPGWKKAMIKPRPGGTITSAKTSFDSPYGVYSVTWKLNGGRLKVDVTVPPNGSAQVVLPGVLANVGSGSYSWEVDWKPEGEWPPTQLKGPTRVSMPDTWVP